VLTDNSGNPKPDGDYAFVFYFYEASTGGSAIWNESKTLSVSKGLFSTSLGDQTPFSSNVKFDKPYWLGIKMGSDPELSPRIAFTSTGYSIISDNIVDGKVVKSLNGLKDNVTLEGSGGTTITSTENKITISSSSGGGSGILGVQNTNNTLNLINPNGPIATVNLKVPLSLSGSISSPENIITANATGNGGGIAGLSTDGPGVVGLSTNYYGVYGNSPGGTGVGGVSETGYGIYAFSANGHGIHAGSNNDYGIVGITTNGWGGVYGEKQGKTHGVLGYYNPTDQLYAGVYGWGGSDYYAARFDGTVLNYGSLYVYNDLGVYGSKNFKIDHPLDPANKYLIHSCIESPDRMNIYNGNISTDGNGLATVELPEYFETLNIDYRYQLTVMGQFAQAIVESEISDNHFTIRTDKPNIKVSWQVTGVRNDAYAKTHPMVVEQEKEEKDKGKYLHPELFGQPEEMGIHYLKTEKPEVTQQQLKNTIGDENEHK